MIIFTDVHLDDDSADIVLGEVLPGVEQASLELKDDLIVCLGDVLSSRYRQSARLLMGLHDAVKASVARGAEWRILPGNHDQFDINGRTVLEMLGNMAGVKVFTQPTVDSWGLWIPYQPTVEKFQAALDCWSGSGNVFMHQAVLGAWMNDNVQCTDGISLESFTRFKRVISGHYHKYHSIGNVTYLGSPWQTRSDEAGQVKGIGHFDGQKLTHLPRVWGPRHVHLEATGPKMDLSALLPTDIVSVKVADGVNLGVLGAQFAAAGIKNHTLTPEVVHHEARLNVGASAGMSDYARAYVAQMAPVGLDQNKLLAMFGEISA